MTYARDSSPTPPPPLEACDVVITDPPPPYPSRERRARTVRSSRRRSGRVQTSDADHDSARIPSYVDNDNPRESNETTPLISVSGSHAVSSRPRSYSHTSTISSAPSFAHTVFSLFQVETDDAIQLDDGLEDRQLLLSGDDNGSLQSSHSTAFFSSAAWKRYFRPLTRKSYYAPLFHLMVVNFPYTLAAWVYLFIFTVVSHVTNRMVRLEANFFFKKKKKRPEPHSLLCYHWVLFCASLTF